MARPADARAAGEKDMLMTLASVLGLVLLSGLVLSLTFWIGKN